MQRVQDSQASATVHQMHLHMSSSNLSQCLSLRPFSHLPSHNQLLYVSQNHADMGPAGIMAGIRATGTAGYVGVVPGDEV